MKKRILSFVLVLVMAIGLLPTIAFAESKTTSDGFTYEIENGEVRILKYDGTATELTIPSEIEGYPVVYLGYASYSDPHEIFSGSIVFETQNLEKVTIPQTVKEIGDGAFWGCEKLKEVSMSNNIVIIGCGAFLDCINLKKITIPDSVTTIGWGVFNNTAYYNDKSKWENGCLYIDNCLVNTKEVSGNCTIDEKIKVMAFRVFNDCKDLETVTIPNSITVIPDNAFTDCQNLTNITFSNSITSIGSGAFEHCGIKEIYFNGTVEKFLKINGIDKLYKYNSNYEKDVYLVTFESNVIFADGSIGFPIYANGGIRGENINLLAVYHENSMKFYGTTSLDLAPYNRELGNTKIIFPEEIIQKTSNIIITNGIPRVNAYAFENNQYVENVSIPLSIVEIKENAFNNCTALKEVFFEGTEEQWNDIVIYPFNDSLKNAKVYFNTTYHEHSFNNYVYNDDATTEKDGTETSKCDKCEKTDTRIKTGSKLPAPKPSIVIKDTSKIFTDIKSTAWFKQYIDYSYTYGIFSGTSATEFSPNTNITRAQFVQVLANLSGIDTKNTNVKTTFSDVPSGKWFTPAVKWASENGVVNGVGDGKFDPNANVTREQMCVMLTNYAKFKGITLKSVSAKAYFADDNKISSWAKDAVYACQMAGIVNGKGENKFEPKGTGTRAEAATIFTRFHKEYLA